MQNDKKPKLKNDYEDYDDETRMVLHVNFPPYTTPTIGLPRAPIPIDECLERYKNKRMGYRKNYFEKTCLIFLFKLNCRYYHIIINGVSDSMVTPLSPAWIENSQKLIVSNLLSDFPDVSRKLFVLHLYSCITCNESCVMSAVLHYFLPIDIGFS